MIGTEKKRMMGTASLLVVISVLSFSETVRGENPEDILIVANSSVPVNSINIDELEDIYLKKRTNWSAGGRVVPVHSPKSSALRREFLKRVLGMSFEQEQMHWKEQKIRHGQSGPPEFKKTLKAVFHLKGSVGYIYRSQYIEGVSKILLVLPAE